MRNIADLSLVAVSPDSSSETTFLQAFPSFRSLFTFSFEKCIPSCNLLANFLRRQSSLSSLLIAHSEDEKGFVPYSDSATLGRRCCPVQPQWRNMRRYAIWGRKHLCQLYVRFRLPISEAMFYLACLLPGSAEHSLERLTIVIPLAFGRRPNEQLDFLEEEMDYFWGMMGSGRVQCLVIRIGMLPRSQYYSTEDFEYVARTGLGGLNAM